MPTGPSREANAISAQSAPNIAIGVSGAAVTMPSASRSVAPIALVDLDDVRAMHLAGPAPARAGETLVNYEPIPATPRPDVAVGASDIAGRSRRRSPSPARHTSPSESSITLPKMMLASGWATPWMISPPR
jgi:hypothetical protein